MASKKLVEIPREYLMVIMEAGQVYLTMRRYEEAREVFEGVCELATKSEVPRLALGNLYAVQQEFDKALKFYREALKLTPKNPLTHALMGEVYLLQGKKAAAREELEATLELDSQGKPADFARSLLDAMAKGVLPFSDTPKPSFADALKK